MLQYRSLLQRCSDACKASASRVLVGNSHNPNVRTAAKKIGRVTLLPDAVTSYSLSLAGSRTTLPLHPHSGLRMLSPREFIAQSV